MAMRKRLGPIAGTLLSVALLVAGTGQAFAVQPTEQQVHKLMDAIGLGRSLSQMNTQIAASMKQSLPCVASNYWQDFVDENGSKEFIGRLVPIYQKHFTAEEVDGMVAFYSSPLGQKVLTEIPAAMAEATQAGQQWSHEHGQQMIAKLEQAGTLNSDGRCPATGGAAAASSSALPVAAAIDGSDREEEATPPASRGKASSRSRHHGTVKQKVAPKKSAKSTTKSTTKSKAKVSGSKTSAAKTSGSKTPVKAQAKQPAPPAKPAATAASGT